MSTYKNARKSQQKVHRERSQLDSRRHLGVLEKKKDYKVRALDHQRKKNTLKVLRRKAADKNPDEFYFKMVRTRLEDGVHQCEDLTPKYTPEQKLLMDSQDINYLRFKGNIEKKKIEKLQNNLHFIEVEKPKNKHLIFLDSKKEAESFDASKYFDTPPELLSLTHNRPTTASLKRQCLTTDVDEQVLQEQAKERQRTYKELEGRLKREKLCRVVAQKLELKKVLATEKKIKKKLVAEENENGADVYRWVTHRKK